jgi:hypothetical protein
LIDFSSTNGAFCAVKGTQEGTDLHIDLTRHHCKSPVTTKTVLDCVEFTCKHPRR